METKETLDWCEDAEETEPERLKFQCEDLKPLPRECGSLMCLLIEVKIERGLSLILAKKKALKLTSTAVAKSTFLVIVAYFHFWQHPNFFAMSAQENKSNTCFFYRINAYD